MKKLIIGVIVLVGVLIAADYGLAAAAEYQVSKRMRTELNLTNDPAVDIHGFPFLTQALGGDYSDISVNATGVPVQNKLRDLEVDVDLRHVHVPLSNLLSGNVSSVRIDEVDGQVQVKASDVGRLLGIPDLTITPQSLTTVLGVQAAQQEQQNEQNAKNAQSSLGNQQAGLELSGTIDIAGQQTKVSVFGTISLEGHDIVIKPLSLDLSNDLVSGQLANAISQQLLGRFKVTLSPSDLPLPFTVQPTGVEVSSGALLVRGTAQNVVLTANGGASQ